MLEGDFVPQGQMKLLAGDDGDMLPMVLPPPPAPAAPRPPSAARAARRERLAGRAAPAVAVELPLPPPPPAPTADDREDAVPQPSQAELRWLSFLFVETFALLLLQVVLGVVVGSLALLADCGHSSADVISYGINYLAERQKVPATMRQEDRAPKASIARIDLVGSSFSTAILCVATWFAASEAYQRLTCAVAGDSGEGKFIDASKSGASGEAGIGRALLAFAVVSTAANVGTLLIYRRWCKKPSAPPPDADQGALEMGNFSPPALLGPGPEAATPSSPAPVPALVPPPVPEEMQAMPPAPPGDGSRRSRRDRSPRKGSLNLSGDFSAAAEKACDPSICGDASCSGGGDCSSASGSWSAFLHAIVHPGCNGHHGTGSGKRVETDNSEADSNLNVTAAMLHLVADCMRGITILITAVIIEAGVVSNAEKADAVCALLVAIFVALGSLALVHRMFAALRRELQGWLSPLGARALR